MDKYTNSHGVLFSDMCELLKILPLNHCFYRGKCFTGGYTYFKGDKKSQIDYVITNNIGRAKIAKFAIVETGWHLSDHLPIGIQINVESTIDVRVLLVRAKLLIEDGPREPTRLKIFKDKFNIADAKQLLIEDATTIINECEDKSPDEILNTIYNHVDSILNKTIIINERVPHLEGNDMKDCDRLFRLYLELVKNDENNANDIRKAYDTYQTKRCLLNRQLMINYTDEYKSVLNSHDDKKLWNLIDWSGNANKSTQKEHPTIGEMSEFFSELYEPIANDGDIESLESNVYIPLTDDPISMDEITISSNQMKKGGFDYPREVLQVLLSSISSIILLLLNVILYNSWPSKLCVSLLSLIPKTGNLRLLTNFRDIQMQPLFANLFGRILGTDS